MLFFRFYLGIGLIYSKKPLNGSNYALIYIMSSEMSSLTPKIPILIYNTLIMIEKIMFAIFLESTLDIKLG